MSDKINFINIKEANNPELFELDEANEIVYYALNKFIKSNKTEWRLVDFSFPDMDPFFLNKGLLGLNFLINRMDLNKLSNNIDKVVKAIIFNFIAGNKATEEGEISCWGRFIENQYIVISVYYTKKATLHDIKNRITTILVHELNHLYDNEDIKNMRSKFENDLSNISDNHLDRSNKLNDLYKNITSYRKVVNTNITNNQINISNNQLKYLNWLIDFIELKSISKEILFNLEYKSIDYLKPFSKEVHDFIYQYISKLIFISFSDKYNKFKPFFMNIISTCVLYIQHFIALYNERLL